MQAAKGLLVLLIVVSCSPKRTQLDKEAIGGRYSIEKEKIERNYSIVCGQFFDSESGQILPASLSINGVIHQTDSGEFKFIVLPGAYSITGSFIGKKWLVTENLKIEKGDSVFLKLYLAIDDRPLHK